MDLVKYCQLSLSSGFMIVSIDEASPTGSPVDMDDEKSNISSLSKGSSRGSQQEDLFHKQVLGRDNSICVFCGCDNNASLA